MSATPEFVGIPVDAVDFYDELAHRNDREWWEQNKDRYAVSVREPVSALADALADEFGEMKVFRPQRDLRFSNDKTPYKDRQGALAQVSDGMGYYVAVGPEGLTTGGGSMHLTPDQLARFRGAIDAPASGIALEKLLDALRRRGFGVGGEMLKSRPRGVGADHPRLELLRHKSLIVWRDHGVPDWMSTTGVVAKVRAEWRLVRPTVAWLEEHVGASAAPQAGRG
ncbi:MAG: DUF2461 domain-containing protein [Actinomycetota bacterium]|nr:DUF2461 domain-containing protein [Actinomycetota bacterium]